MSGLTYIARYSYENGSWEQKVFVVPTGENPAEVAEEKRPRDSVLRELKISEAQRLLDPELDHSKMRDEDGIVFVGWEDVLAVGREKELPTDLLASEMRVFLKCVESGMSCWSEVVELALMAATSERSGS